MQFRRCHAQELGLDARRTRTPCLAGDSTAADLFESRADLVCTTSALKHPVFVGGENFTGHSRQVEQCSFFESCLTELLLPLLDAHSKALIIPLVDFVAQRLTWLSTRGFIDARRVLFQFPHPSGANGHRKARFAAARTEMADTGRRGFRPQPGSRDDVCRRWLLRRLLPADEDDEDALPAGVSHRFSSHGSGYCSSRGCR